MDMERELIILFSDIFPGEMVAPQSFKVKYSISGMYKLISLAVYRLQ
jgi:hypothetical protein